ncbi:MAG: hypothetical protein ACLFQX_05700 [Candidatus Kapaibacterium sp.]
MKTQTLRISFILMLIAPLFCYSQEKAPHKFYLHAAVDTTFNPQFGEPIRHWVEFLYETDPDIQKTYWEPSELESFGGDYCLVCGGIFQYGRATTMKYFSPYILSVGYIDGLYIIQTMLTQNPLKLDDSVRKNQNPVTILRIAVEERDGKYYLKNMLPLETRFWNRYNYGNITYITEPSVAIDSSDCRRAGAFLDSLSMIWQGRPYDKQIDYYVTRNSHALNRAAGMDFAFMGSFVGIGLYDAGILLSGRGNFFYKHELAHMVIPASGNMLYTEGMATYFGGSAGYSFVDAKDALRENFYPVSKEEIDQILEWRNSLDYYTLGSILIEIIIDEKGLSAAKELAGFDGSDEEYINKILVMLDFDKSDLLDKINSILK